MKPNWELFNERIERTSCCPSESPGGDHALPKDANNPYFKSKYASLPAVREAMQAAFAKNGLSVVQMPEVVDGQLKLRTLLLHSSGQCLDCGSLAAEVELVNPQKIGSAITYFRRYALAAISQTVADEDDDGNAATHPAKPVSNADQDIIRDATAAINSAETLDELTELGELFRTYSVGVKTALRPVYEARKRVMTA